MRETACFETRLHEILLVGVFLRAVAVGALGLGCVLLGWPWSAIGAAVLAFAALTAVVAAWRWERTRVVVTTDSLYLSHGTVRRRESAVRLDRVGKLEIEQTLLGRLLGYGTLIAGDLEIPYVPQPRQLYGLVVRLGA